MKLNNLYPFARAFEGWQGRESVKIFNFMPQKFRPGSDLGQSLAAVVTICVVVLLAYGTSLKNPFHFDDLHTIQNNPAIQFLDSGERSAAQGFWEIWSDPSTSSILPQNRSYRPLLYTSHALLWGVGGGSVIPFHVFKLILFAALVLGTLLFWTLFGKSLGWTHSSDRQILLLLGVVFAAHPAMSEAVNYISASSSLFCATLSVWALVFYWMGRERGQLWLLGLASLIFLMALLTKEEAIAVLPIAILLDYGVSPSTNKISLRPYLPLALVGIFFLIFWIWIQPLEGSESRGSRSSLNYFLTQVLTWPKYLALYLWPNSLNADNMMPFIEKWKDHRLLLGFVANAAIFWVLWISRKAVPALVIGGIWFYLALMPTSSVVVLAEAMNERRMVFAFCGLFGASAGVLIWAREILIKTLPSYLVLVRRVAMVGLVTLLGMGVYLSNERNRVWASSKTLWEDTLLKNPDSGRAMNNLALDLMEREPWLARAHLDRCIKVWPSYAYCYLNRGILVQRLSNDRQAQRDFKKALSLDPDNVDVLYTLAQEFNKKGNLKKALTLYHVIDQRSGGRYPRIKKKISRIQKARNRVQRGHVNSSLVHSSAAPIPHPATPREAQ